MSIEEIVRYVLVTLGVSIIIFIPVVLCRGCYLIKRGNHKPIYLKRELAYGLFAFYVICLFQITALRFGGIGWDMEEMLARNTRVNIVPFVVLIKWFKLGIWWHLIYNVVGNCIWFIPLGYIIPRLFEGHQKGWKVILVGGMVSASIEISQYIFCTGVTDVDDLIINIWGTAIGYFLWLWVQKAKKSIS